MSKVNSTEIGFIEIEMNARQIPEKTERNKSELGTIPEEQENYMGELRCSRNLFRTCLIEFGEIVDVELVYALIAN